MSTVLIITMAFVLMFSHQASAGGILQIPSKDSLAHCIQSCGDIDISYPFGVGSDCFRQGFQLTCNYSTKHHPSKLFLGSSSSSAIQITRMEVDPSGAYLATPIIFHLATRPGSTNNTYNMSWKALAEGITIGSDNTLFVAGCDFDVTLLEYGTGDIIGSCTSRCAGKKVPNGGPCNGIGCCLIPFSRDLPGFRAKLVSTNTTATQSDWLHPGIMGIVTRDGSYYMNNATDIVSSWKDARNIGDAMLIVSIMDQPSCESAQMHNASYACSSGSSCQDSSSAGTGYHCYCSSYGLYDNNPYILDGCPQQDYNPKPNERCHTSSSCGTITVPFPFGIEEGCFANERFRLNCTSGNLTIVASQLVQYNVTNRWKMGH
uniref:Uncharacterized protein n=1 Tax=Avena sativa TaxID=4498 RepID=A0ACD5Y396_AVESA